MGEDIKNGQKNSDVFYGRPLSKAAARRHQHILTAWPSISSSKELELSDFDGELGTAAAAAAFTLS